MLPALPSVANQPVMGADLGAVVHRNDGANDVLNIQSRDLEQL